MPKTKAYLAITEILAMAIIVLSPLGLSACSNSSAATIRATHYQDEQQYLLDSIGADISEIVLFSARKVNSADVDLASIENKTTEFSNTSYQYDLNWKGNPKPETFKFALTDYLWSPANFAPWAKQLLDDLKLKSSDSGTGESADNLLGTLANYNSEVIANENTKSSLYLNEHPLDPQAHENAAILCAVVAWRECAGCFENTRPALNRICAHLSIAKALKNDAEFSSSGKVAELILLCLGGRESEALDRAKDWEKKIGKPNQSLQSWLNAIKIRCTNDYRIADIENGMLVEKFAYMRALSVDRTVASVDKWLQKLPDDERSKLGGIDWQRIALQGAGSVSTGHEYAEGGVEFERHDYKEDYALFKSPFLQFDAIADLNLDPTRCLIKDGDWKLAAISWGDVAAFHARQIIESIFQKHQFESQMWGVPETASETIAQEEQNYGSLKQFPLCKLSMLLISAKNKMAEMQNHLDSIKLVSELTSTTPQNVNAYPWRRVAFNEGPPHSIPSPSDWYVPIFPFGTAFEIQSRLDFVEKQPIEELEKLKALCPYKQELIMLMAHRKYGSHPNPEQLAKELGDLPNFNTAALLALSNAYKDDPKKYCEMLEKVAEQDAYYYFRLGYEYVTIGEPDKAMAAYEKGIARCEDSVGVANSSDWAVHYYLDHGQKDKAIALATKCADVYSHGGLLNMAQLQERLGNLSEAESYLLKDQERYEHNEAINEFYFRHAKENSDYKKKSDQYVQKLFPNGLKKDNPAAHIQPPKSGAGISTESPLTKKFGVKKGDVIVAVNGYSVENQKQYMFVRSMELTGPTSNPGGDKINLIMWNGKSYRNLSPVLPYKKFGCELFDFKG